ncbi:RNA-guided endonuclease InsQ/TnpB family protein [Thiofilum flexile]|uniref:RNA-guided endonuclease InsQ/TnpB family protein n=1 Tax=Thiofilum flexile TaxID=125627 RepID=UPI000363F774|nr:RNA-guided endonuclease TnpB family protein [Thiofilum flexile]
MTSPLVTVLKTLKVRVKDKHTPILERMAFEVNQVWNAANEQSAYYAAIPVPEVGWLHIYVSAYDLANSQAALRKERGFLIHSQTVQEVTEAHEKARKQFKKSKLCWRISSGSKHSLGWIPFKKGAAVWKNGQVRYAGHYFKVWDSYGLSQYEFRSGSFSQDARGRWYFNVVVAVPVIESIAQGQIGIDLGLKDAATCSNGLKLESKQFYRELESKLGIAQRAKQKKRVKAIHAKIKNRRLDTIHQFTTQVVKDNSLIVIGDVSSSALAKTKMAKSVLDAGWYMLKIQLKYKAIMQSAMYLEVNESYTTQTCSSCGCISPNSPKGRTGLRIREWSCSECGAMHDRDVNAAKNILALGHERLAAGIPVL